MTKALLLILSGIVVSNTACFSECDTGYERENMFAECKPKAGSGSSTAPTPTPDPYANVTISYNGVPESYSYSDAFGADNTITALSPTSNITSMSLLTNFTSTPALPNGLNIDSTTGIISGQLNGIWEAGTYTISAQKPESSGSVSTDIRFGVYRSGQTDIDWNIDEERNFNYATVEATHYVGLPITANAPSHRGRDYFSYTYSGTYSSVEGFEQYGLSFDMYTGVISGTPQEPAARKAYTMFGNVTGGGSVAVIYITIINGPPLSLTYNTLSAIYPVGQPIVANTPSHTGGNIASYSISPSLPAGLSFNTTTGVISGTPTTITAAATYTITATNTSGSINKTISIAVDNSPPGNLSYQYSSARFTVGAAISNNLPIIGSGGTPASYSISPSLSAGLSFNTSSGLISGTPTAASASATYTITATNAAGSTTTSLSFLVVSPGPHTIYSADGYNIKAYSVDISNGAPIYVGNTYASPISSKLIMHPTLDCAFGYSGSSLYALAVNKSQQGQLSAINSAGGVSGPINLAMHTSGNLIFILNAGGIATYSVNGSCNVSYVTSTAVSSPKDMATTGNHIYVLNSGAQIIHFTTDSNGTLTQDASVASMVAHNNPPSLTPALGTPRYLRASPSGAYVYATDSLKAVESFSIDSGTGSLTYHSAMVNGGYDLYRSIVVDGPHEYIFSCYQTAIGAGVAALKLNSDGTTGISSSIDGSSIVPYYSAPQSVDVFTSESGTYVYTTFRYPDYSYSGAIRMLFNPSTGAWASYSTDSGLWGVLSGY